MNNYCVDLIWNIQRTSKCFKGNTIGDILGGWGVNGRVLTNKLLMKMNELFNSIESDSDPV